MVSIASSIPGLYPNPLRFTTYAHSSINLIHGFWLESTGTIPEKITHLIEETSHHVFAYQTRRSDIPEGRQSKSQKIS